MALRTIVWVLVLAGTMVCEGISLSIVFFIRDNEKIVFSA